MTEFVSEAERRAYPRYNAPVCYRPAPFFSSRKPAVDIGLGGIRIYSDDKFKVGKRLELELFLPNGDILMFTAKVVWQNELPPDETARYDVGLQFLDVPQDKLKVLKEVLGANQES
jgi:Tfp pilus assembly protein PilZ